MLHMLCVQPRRGESPGGELLKTHDMKKAFTLIELLVVVAIIAVIGAGVAVMYGREVVDDARKQMTIHEMGQIRDAFNRFWADNSTQMMGGMTVANYNTLLPDASTFEFAASDDKTYSSSKSAESQRLYGVLQSFERHGLWPLLQKSVHRKDDDTQIQIFYSSLDNRKYEFKVPSPVTGEGWRGPYLNSVSCQECVLNGNLVEVVAANGNSAESRIGITSGRTIDKTEVRFPQPKTKYDDGGNGGIYRIVYYEHCATKETGMPIYRRLLLMAAMEPLQYDTWDEIKVFAGNRRYSSANGMPLNLETGAIDAYDAKRGVFFMELLNFDTVWR